MSPPRRVRRPSRILLWEGEVPDVICQLPELGLSCFGCCGYDWAPVHKLKREVENNTWRYKTFYTKKEIFAETTEGVKASGICKGVMFLEDGTIGCPLHPARNRGIDFRKGDCIKNYECNTLKHYKRWSKDLKRQFLSYVAEKDLDSFQYSMANAKGTFLSSFKRKKGLSRFRFLDPLR